MPKYRKLTVRSSVRFSHYGSTGFRDANEYYVVDESGQVVRTFKQFNAATRFAANEADEAYVTDGQGSVRLNRETEAQRKPKFTIKRKSKRARDDSLGADIVKDRRGRHLRL